MTFLVEAGRESEYPTMTEFTEIGFKDIVTERVPHLVTVASSACDESLVV